ncbi:hypothetical protein G9A89_017613 [Geosiphon pyriformis]|nr:hypothetical protein G9A89_017613 [Geosiphon pyriformis]
MVQNVSAIKQSFTISTYSQEKKFFHNESLGNNNFSLNKLLVRSTEGFGRKIKNSPPKTLVTDSVLVESLEYFAQMANIPYCRPIEDNLYVAKHFICDVFYEKYKKMMVGYFRGLEMTRKQWEKEKFILKQYKTGSSLDERWAKEFESVDGKDSPVMLKIINAVISLANSTVTKGEGFNFYLIGHGIGGAYAQIAAMALVSSEIREILNIYIPDRPMKVTLLTFGQPRVGDEKHAKALNFNKDGLTIYRITNRNDFVPQFPKRDFLNYRRYAHAETEFWISDIDCDCDEIPSYSNSYALYKCPGFFNKNGKFGENQNCNSGTDGLNPSANFGPYFGTTFGDCRNLTLETFELPD